ncbi:MAG: serine protease [Myxococcota bacterium]|nr:serine protease [Myxococcota bacterium]
MAAGGQLPYETTHGGIATAALINETGYLLTNQHLISAGAWFAKNVSNQAASAPEDVQSPLASFDGTFSQAGSLLPHAEILTADHRRLGNVSLHYLDRALNLAVLKLVEPPMIKPLPLRKGPVGRHERIWQWGYPPHTARSASFRAFLGYEDARGHPTYSPGLVVSQTDAKHWFTDADAAFGSSGGAVLDDQGRLVGVRCGGGARALPQTDWFRYTRTTDVYALRDRLPAEVWPA